MPVRVLRSASVGTWLAAVLASSPVLAIDLSGRAIRITGLQRDYAAVHRLSGQPDDSYSPAATPTSDAIGIYQDGRVLAWQPTASPSCQSPNGFTSVAVLYALPGKKSGKFNCVPHETGGASDFMVTRTQGTYTSSSVVAGNVITLTGRMTVQKTVEMSNNGAVHTVTHSTQIVRQSARIEITGGTCNVLAYEQRADDHEDARSTDGVGYVSSDDKHNVLSPTSALGCAIE